MNSRKNNTHQIVVTNSLKKNSTTSPCGSFYTVSNAVVWFLLLLFLLIRGVIKEKLKKGAKNSNNNWKKPSHQFRMKCFCFVFLAAFKYRFHVLFYTSNLLLVAIKTVCHYCCCRCCCCGWFVCNVLSHDLPPAFVSITPLFDVYKWMWIVCVR